MELYRITIPKDDAWRVIEAAGNMGQLHFVDLNKSEQAFQLPYASRIKLCEESERRLIFLKQKCEEMRIRVHKPKSHEIFKENIHKIAEQKQRAANLLFDAIDADIADKEKFVASQSKTISEMRVDVNKMLDYAEVLKFVSSQSTNLGNAMPAMAAAGDMENGQNQPLIDGGIQISFVAGTIKGGDEPDRMNKMIFRFTRGKALTYFQDFIQGEERKTVYMVVYQDGAMIRERVQRICDSFMGQRFEVPPLQQIAGSLEETTTEIAKAQNLLRMSEAQLTDYLKSINKVGNMAPSAESPSMLEIYAMFVAKEKAIYTAMNMLRSRDARDTTFTGFIWSPLQMEQPVKEALSQFPTVDFKRWRASLEDPLPFIPPTYFKSNDVIAIPQLITNTYGVPHYEEANPATFAVVTFPFLFAVMFGDYGHGSIIFVAGLILTLGVNKLRAMGVPEMALQMRYMLLMMGFFSCYNGLLYNEWFAFAFDWFGTCYNVDQSYVEEAYFQSPAAYPVESEGSINIFTKGTIFPDQVTVRGVTVTDFTVGTPNYECTYPFGLDPTWFLDEEQILNEQNSFKEKLSVIFAVLHMSLGIMVKGLNAVYFKWWIVLFFEVITGLIIFWGLFGFMDLLIIIKWFTPYYAYNFLQKDTPEYNEQFNAIANAPSITNVLINDFLALAKQNATYTYFPYADYQNVLFAGQEGVALTLNVLILISVPLYLCVKPCVNYCQHKDDHKGAEFERAAEEEAQPIVNPDAVQIDAGDNYTADKNFWEAILKAEFGADDEHHEVGEMFIHQMIETIEFVLGCISNTASYLRLWALSLAHSQLALVFLMLLYVPWRLASSVWLVTLLSFLMWFPFMTVTWAVLMQMDTLECFLHTLRLHWVEFQNKFYKGDGYLYVPFDFETVFEKQVSS